MDIGVSIGRDLNDPLDNLSLTALFLRPNGGQARWMSQATRGLIGALLSPSLRSRSVRFARSPGAVRLSADERRCDGGRIGPGSR